MAQGENTMCDLVVGVALFQCTLIGIVSLRIKPMTDELHICDRKNLPNRSIALFCRQIQFVSIFFLVQKQKHVSSAIHSQL